MPHPWNNDSLECDFLGTLQWVLWTVTDLTSLLCDFVGPFFRKKPQLGSVCNFWNLVLLVLICTGSGWSSGGGWFSWAGPAGRHGLAGLSDCSDLADRGRGKVREFFLDETFMHFEHLIPEFGRIWSSPNCPRLKPDSNTPRPMAWRLLGSVFVRHRCHARVDRQYYSKLVT